MRRSPSWSARLRLSAPLLLLVVVGCNCGDPDEPDGGAPSRDAGVRTDAGGPTDAGEPDGGLDDAGRADAGDDGGQEDGGFGDAGGTDAGVDDAGDADAGDADAGDRDAGDDDGGYDDDGGAPDVREPPPPFHPQPIVTTCPGDSLPPPPEGRCAVTSGSGATLFTADVLTPGEVLRGGQVLVDDSGTIACVSCDCGGEPDASEATRVVCPDVVISPGIINAHDHVTFAGAWPYGDTRPGGTNRMSEERYEHRHDWRDGLDGHTRIPSLGGTSSTMAMKWLEWRQLMSGTTSILGSGGPEGFLRNLDSASRSGLAREPATYQTFPLGDAVSGLKLYDSCEYEGCSGPDCFDAASEAAFVPHVAEGIDRYARNEMLCLSRGGKDVSEPQSAFIHGVGLLPVDMAEMAEEEVELIWSPRSNITLYGDTARVTEFARLGVTIGLGTDWVATGSMNMLRELACADDFNQRYLDHFFSDEQLWLMATRNAARALRVDDVLGSLTVGAIADLVLYDASHHRDHRAVLMARPEDVALVVIAGKVQYGDDALVDALAPGCELLPEVCGTQKRACLADETCYPGCTAGSGSPTPCTWALLRACGDEHEASPQYPAWFCHAPDDEPSCLPARTSTGALFPDASVDGSNRYDGMSSLDDVDGDGVWNDEDNCPWVFNPIRPLDDGAQADADGDGLGDACDPCPLGGDEAPETCNLLPHHDLDRDGVPRDEDVCPDLYDPEQEDADEDGIGDACDPCPTFATARGGATVYGARCGALPFGEWTTLSGIVVTALSDDGFFAQVPPGSPDYAGAAYSGIFVWTELVPDVARGELVEVTGRLQQGALDGLAHLVVPAVTSLGVVAEPDAVVVEPLLIATGGASAVPYESVLVQVDDVEVTAPSAGGDFVITDDLVVGGGLFAIDPAPALDERFDFLRGVLVQRGVESKLLPREAVDVGFTTFRLSPGRVEVQVGHPVTFAVSLPTEAPPEGALVSLSLDPPGLLDGPTEVFVPAGERHASVEWLAGEDAGDATLRASLDELEAAAAVSVVTAGRLLFSEYVEGSANNKALELTNVGGSPASLADCVLRLYANGSATPTSSVALSGTLAPGAQLVVCNPGTDSAETRCHLTSPTVNHNGDDAYALECLGEVVDTFGRVGERPTAPSSWTGGGLGTLDFVLRRRCDVETGDADGSDAFDPSVEWTGEPWQSPALSLAGLNHRDECLPLLDGGPDDDGGLDDGGSE